MMLARSGLAANSLQEPGLQTLWEHACVHCI